MSFLEEDNMMSIAVISFFIFMTISSIAYYVSESNKAEVQNNSELVKCKAENQGYQLLIKKLGYNQNNP